MTQPLPPATLGGMRSVACCVLAALLASTADAQPADDAPPAPIAGSLAEALGRPAPSMSLPEVLEVAVRQSPALADAAIDVAIAEAAVLEATGIEDWLLSASAGWFRLRDQPVAGDVVGTNSLDQVDLSAGISKLLPTGGTVSMNVGSSRRETLFSFSGAETLQVRTEVSASLVQPLLRGRGSAITRAAQGQSRQLRDAARLDEEARARQVVRDIISAYWEVAYALAALDIRRSALDLARTRRALTEKGVELGSAPRTALTEVDQVIATREEEILVAELDVAERALELRRLAGLAIGPGDIELVPSEPLAVRPRDLDLDAIVAASLASSPELAALGARGESAKIAVEVTENDLLPRLDLSLEGGPLGTSDSTDDSLQRLAEVNGYSVSANLRFEQRLGRRTARGSHQAARARLRRVEVTRRDLRAQIATAAVRAVRLAKAASQRMELSQRAIGLAEQNTDAEQRRFELGRATNFDVLERQEELKQARLRYARAAVDYLLALAFLDSLTGDLLERYGISLGA